MEITIIPKKALLNACINLMMSTDISDDDFILTVKWLNKLRTIKSPNISVINKSFIHKELIYLVNLADLKTI